MSSRLLDLVLPLGIIGCLMVILVPLPPGILDVLLAANITIGVIILLTTIQVKTPFEFGIFPTLLLATVLSRVVLNIATTRLILTNGATEQAAAAGGVIQSFGEFVAGNQIAVGLVIFAIIVVVQFVVITKGATRISEVAARFALDGMPGRQMAIDADLNAEIIDAKEATRRRQELQMQSDFYGTMDGASKFVRGDAIAGIVITLINIVGGLVIGMTAGMSLPQAAETFTKLTIGDGLVSQIPGLLISLAAGILISRSTRETNLPAEFMAQLFSRPQVLLIAGGFLLALIFTQLPALPLLAVGGGCIAIAMLLPEEKATEATPVVDAQQREKHRDNRIKQLLTVDPIEIELGVNLVNLCHGEALLGQITDAREKLAAELGIVLPKVRVRDNLELPGNEYRIRINQLSVAKGVAEPGQILAVKRIPGAASPDGTPTAWHFGHGAFWVQENSVANRAREYTRLTPSQVVVETLKHQCRQRAHQILNRQSTAFLIEKLKETNPASVDELIPDLMSIGQIQQVLQRLLLDGVSIRPLSVILEALSDAAVETKDPVSLTERVRARLAPWITNDIQAADGIVRVIQFDTNLTDWLISETNHGGASNDRSHRQWEALFAQLQPLHQQAAESHLRVVVCVPSELRQQLQEQLRHVIPGLNVVAAREISRESKIETIAILRFDDVHYFAA